MCSSILRTFARNLNLPPTRVITLRVTAVLHPDLTGESTRLTWTRVSSTRVPRWNRFRMRLKLCTIDHLGPEIRLKWKDATMSASKPYTILAKACFGISHHPKQFQEIQAIPSPSINNRLPDGRRQVSFYNAWSSRAGFRDGEHVLTFRVVSCQNQDFNIGMHAWFDMSRATPLH